LLSGGEAAPEEGGGVCDPRAARLPRPPAPAQLSQRQGHQEVRHRHRRHGRNPDPVLNHRRCDFISVVDPDIRWIHNLIIYQPPVSGSVILIYGPGSSS
jgi:hypothetical protein